MLRFVFAGAYITGRPSRSHFVVPARKIYFRLPSTRPADPVVLGTHACSFRDSAALVMVAEHVAVSEQCLTVLTDEQSIGLIFIIVCSFLSFLAIAVTLILYIDRVFKIWCYSSGTRVFLKTDVDVYFLSLLFADMLVAVSGIMNLKWVNERQTSCSGFCSVQGGLEHIGTPAVALSTLAIALHTFFVVFFRWTPPRTRSIGFFVLIGIWTFLFLLVLVPALSLSSDPSKPPFYTPSPAWCYIGTAHIALRAGASYVFAWLAAIGSGVLYVLLFFRLRGALPERRVQGRLSRTLSAGLRRWWSGEFNTSRDRDGQLLERVIAMRGDGEENDPEGRRILTIYEARKMLWYPCLFTITILPISATRWTSFTEYSSHSPPRHEVPFGVTAAAASLFKLGGVIDVLLFTFTRPNVLLFSASREVGVGEGSTSSRRNPIARLRRDWSSWLRGWKRRGGESEGEMEMQDMTRPDSRRGEIRTLLSTEEDGRVDIRSQILLVPRARASSGLESRQDQDGRRDSSSRRSTGNLDEGDPLNLDLSEEFDYKPVSIPNSPFTAPPRGSSLRVREGRHLSFKTRSSFSPLTLDLPDPRTSGLSDLIHPWMPMQREERVAFLNLSPCSMPGSIGASSQGRDLGGTTSTNEAPADGWTTRKVCRFDASSGSDVPGDFPGQTGYDHVDISETPETRNIVDESSTIEIPIASAGGEQSLENSFVQEDLLSASSVSRRDSTSSLASRERRLRGPRPPPVHKLSSSSDTFVTHSRPVRPTIGIPSPRSFRASPSYQSSTRSPRIRFPHSALAAIPEHRLLDSFPPTSLQSPPSIAPTSPLFFREKRPPTRPRSLSDGAVRSQGHRGKTALDVASGSRSKYSSFINMT
ncbi:hypothetical protein A7U60_g2315 [Sanghuangporus baumii]|uniref:Glucose receptor Git3 N-terminal domain-containing protein n=1 Tax=Sanghuangporus baumii TaxID=108892 RepID=A0A9Q5I2G6_SANBA|nr:hypothetical protein A7U60_g2315 [Sanghuangporus baumii]